MTDRIDATVHQVQATGSNAMIDRGRPEAERDELAARDHAVLAGGDGGNFHVWGDLTAHTAV
jgi:hypothetical protein